MDFISLSYRIWKKAWNGRVVQWEDVREKLSSAESSFGWNVDEVHPGADLVSFVLARYVLHTLRVMREKAAAF